jgi:hypothetical protein
VSEADLLLAYAGPGLARRVGERLGIALRQTASVPPAVVRWDRLVARVPQQWRWSTQPLAAALAAGAVTPIDFALRATPGWAAVRTLEQFALLPDYSLLGTLDRVLDAVAALLPGNGGSEADGDLSPDDAVAAWLWLITRAPTHPGTFPELCADAVRAGRNRRAHRPLALEATPFPREKGLTQQEWVLYSPVGMLARARPDIAARVIATLPMYAIHGFLNGQRLPAHVLFPTIRHMPALAASLASHAEHAPEITAELLALRMPMVLHGLLDRTGDIETAHAVHLATRQDAPARVPLTSFTRRNLRHPPGEERRGLALAVYGHHPDLLRRALRDAHEHLGTAGVLRGLLSLWQCRGRMALLDPRVMAHLPPDCAEIVRSVTKRVDGYRRLRAAVAEYESPAALVEAVRGAPQQTYRHFPPAFWPAATEAHARDPLPRATAYRLATHPACPDALSLAVCRTDAEAAAMLANRSREHALTALRHHPLPWPPRSARPRHGVPDVEWYVRAVARERLSAREFVELGRPARHALEAVEIFAPYCPEARAEARTVIAEHTEVLGGDPDAWSVAVRLLPEFHGTLPELVATAAAVFR